jgi:GMP synthase-like glutamine amidotransferase
VILVVDLCQRDLSKSEFVEPIAAIVGDGARVARSTDLVPGDVEAASAVVICGTALADDGYMDHIERFDWLRTTRTPVLGICAGMQLIALLHGGRVVERREIGMTSIHPIGEDPLIPGPMEVYSLHKYDLEDLNEFHVLARSTECVQAIAHRERDLFGILFHPEVRCGEVVTRFLERFVRKAGP